MKIEEQLEVALAEFKASYLEKITQWSKEQVERNIERRNAYRMIVRKLTKDVSRETL